MKSAAEYAFLLDNGMAFSEVYELIKADLVPHEFEVGETVWYNESRGVVLERIESDREGSDDYLSEWEDGVLSVEWGSDLTREGPARDNSPETERGGAS